jgi:hypothetical protein
MKAIFAHDIDEFRAAYAAEKEKDALRKQRAKDRRKQRVSTSCNPESNLSVSQRVARDTAKLYEQTSKAVLSAEAATAQQYTRQLKKELGLV